MSNLDGSRIATLGGRGNISLFREEESPTATGPMPVMTDNALRLSADGRTLAVGGRGGELYVARLEGDAGEAGYRLRRLRLPAPALQYEISPDGASIVTAKADGTVTISDLTFGSSASGAPANQVQTAGAEPESTPVPAPPVTVAETVEISGHGAPLTAMALSPDGERLATASLDGRLRITSIAWARLVHRLPFAALPSGPERAKLEPQPLDESPYVLMGQTVTSGRFDDNEPFDQPFIIVYNARKSLGQALGARERAAEAGFPGALILRRQGFFRGVFAFATAEARDAALPGIQEVFSGAYSRDLRSWCPDAVPNENFLDCTAVVAGTGAAAGDGQLSEAAAHLCAPPGVAMVPMASRVPAPPRRARITSWTVPHAVLGTQSTSTPTAAMPASVTRLVIQFQRRSDCCRAADEAPIAGWNVCTSHSYFSPLSSGRIFGTAASAVASVASSDGQSLSNSAESPTAASSFDCEPCGEAASAFARRARSSSVLRDGWLQ